MSFVSANMAYVRHTLGFSQNQMADKLGIKRSLLGAYEEARATPRYDVLEQLSQLSGHSVADLLNKRLVPEDFRKGSKRGRPAGVRKVVEARPERGAPHMAIEVAFDAPGPPMVPTSKVQPDFAPTLTLTVDTSGLPQAGLVGYPLLAQYGRQAHLAAFIAALPSLTLPMLEQGHAYRAFELEPGRIHIGKWVRNWAGIVPDAEESYVLVYADQVALAYAEQGPKGLSWHREDNHRGEGRYHSLPRNQEPLEIWQSIWVLTRYWKPLPAALNLLHERMAALEAKLG